MGQGDELRAGDRYRTYCMWCEKETLHTVERVGRLRLEGHRQQDALSPRCENHASHGRKKAA